MNSSINDTIEHHRSFMTFFCFYFKLMVIGVGMLGNIMSIVEFIKFRLSTGTVGQYLITLALADNLVLISELPIWMTQIPLEYLVIDAYDWICRFTYYLKYAGRIWSACLTLVVTVERFLFVAHPLKKAHFQKHHIHRILIPFTLTASLSFVSYALFLIKVQEVQILSGGIISNATQCFILQDKRKLFVVLDIIVVRGIGDLLIGVLILIFTILSIKVLLQAQKLRTDSLRERSSLCSSCGNQIHGFHRKSYKSRESQITRMLLMLAVMFLLFKLPYAILYYVTLNWYKREASGFSTIETVVNNAKSISLVFALMGYAFNFFVYVVLVPSFRSNLCATLKCKWILDIFE